jgi:RHS repeat-associated protein
VSFLTGHEEKSPAFLAGQSEAYAYDDIYRLIEYKVGDLVGSDVPVPITQRQYDLDKVGNWDQFTVDDDGAGPGVPVVYNNTPNQMNEYDDWSTNGPGEIPDDLGLDINFADPVPTPPEDGENWAHDKNGNRREDGKRIYEYDDENRLIRVTRKVDGVVSEYRYDALARRVVKVVDVLGTPVVTRYAYDDARVIEEQDALGNTLATYVYGNYIDEVLNMQRGGADFYYHQNALWSVAAVSDASGDVVERYAYTDYGCPTVTDGAGGAVAPNAWGTAHSAVGNPYMFTGRRWDEESGLYYYRARYYDCEAGRFVSVDALGYADGLNRLQYCLGNPVRYSDPSGLRCCLEKVEIRDSGPASIKGPLTQNGIALGLRVVGEWIIYGFEFKVTAKYENSSDKIEDCRIEQYIYVAGRRYGGPGANECSLLDDTHGVRPGPNRVGQPVRVNCKVLDASVQSTWPNLVPPSHKGFGLDINADTLYRANVSEKGRSGKHMWVKRYDSPGQRVALNNHSRADSMVHVLVEAESSANVKPRTKAWADLYFHITADKRNNAWTAAVFVSGGKKVGIAK